MTVCQIFKFNAVDTFYRQSFAAHLIAFRINYQGFIVEDFPIYSPKTASPDA
jgi:hypothetical protein